MIYTITLNPTIDRLLYLGGKLTKEKNNRLDRVAYDLGGKGHHGSYAMSKLGVENQALGFCGTTNKRKLEKILEEKGINHDLVEVYGKPTRESYVLLEKDVSGSILITEKGYAVSNYDKSLLFDKIEEKVEAEDTVLIAGSMPPGFEIEDLEKLINLLNKIGCFIACDLSGEALKAAVKTGINFIKPNRFEILEIAEQGKSLLDTVKELTKTIDYVIVSQGGAGSLCGHKNEFYQITPPVVVVKNDTGAGDCFVGSFLASLTQQKTFVEALTMATACSASKVQHDDSTSFSVKDAQNLQEKVILEKL
ncbi:1-phosphofructokinase family hexose kinase [Carnobacterium sp. ISL-102]|uniref:1-phosphofructokinase family hexose kinase n=1 Tax=Carnobacterium sp. ISL-102 TaxID=2819142 RepID=UPI001BE8CFB0|nr:1-phosphofructokinase family hexose kinase [Carnobacterium sp. ISL-102]MBT2731808.1 1-phosphofructokinase family hexose kinase [Carnobacterium sp. ISL-102]